MARIYINIVREGRPTIVGEDIVLAAQHAGLGDEIDIISAKRTALAHQVE